MSSFPVTWVLVADCGRSRLFALDAHGFNELEDAINPTARLHEAELASDRPGDSAGRGRHPMPPAHSQKEQSNEEFARELSGELKDALNAGRFERLVLISPPEFLGILRHELDAGVCQTVVEVVGLDLTRASAADISRRLPPLSSLS